MRCGVSQSRLVYRHVEKLSSRVVLPAACQNVRLWCLKESLVPVAVGWSTRVLVVLRLSQKTRIENGLRRKQVKEP